MVIKTSVLWLPLIVPLLLVGTQGSADQRPGKHTHDDKAPHGATAGEHGPHHGPHHQHDTWETPPAAYASKRSTRWADPAAIARGEKLFETNCQTCHGVAGTGTGPAATSLAHPPADLTHHFHHEPGDGDAYLFWRVSEGGTVEPFKAMQSAMPAFKTILSEDQRWDVLAYVHAYFHLGLANWHPEKRDSRPSEKVGQQIFVGEGKVLAVMPNAQQIVVEHGEIKGFMGAMTMGYKVTPPSLLDGFKVGDPIRFTIDAQQKAIVKIEKLQK